MNTTELEQLLESDIDRVPIPACETLAGLNIMTKYLPNTGVEGAEHDMIYGASLDELSDAGITTEDVTKLAQMGWFIQNDSLCHFV